MSEFGGNVKATGYFIWWAIIIVVVIGGLSFGYYKFVAPQVEEARTGIYENSQAHIRGIQADLRDLQLQYTAAENAKDGATKTVLQAAIREKVSSFDLSKLSPDLRSFVESILDGRR